MPIAASHAAQGGGRLGGSARGGPVPLGRVATTLAIALLGLAGACAGPRSPALAEAAKERQIRGQSRRLEELQAESERLDQQILEEERELDETRAEAEDVAGALLLQADELARVVATLKAAEEDLADAKRRDEEVRKELADLRAAEALVADRTRLLEEAEQRLVEIDAALAERQKQVAAAEAALAEHETAVRARLELLERRMEAAGKMDETLTQALEKVLEQAGPFQRPPPPEPAPDPAAKPEPGGGKDG